MIPWLSSDISFPPAELALVEPNGLLAVGGDLSCKRLIHAYSKGIFPWFNDDEPILWWSPDPRMVLFPAELKISRSLRKALQKNHYQVFADRAFDQVIAGCAAPRRKQRGTWINRKMIDAYVELFRMGHAHSVETWIDGELCGGLYGVALGRAFFGESMFSRATDASKIAFVHLVKQLARWNFGVIDCQMKTAHLASLGAREIPRTEFTRFIEELIHYGDMRGSWRLDNDLLE
ncbi:MAG TPA: leucyl/phenylalanyl-tRNA--protein transferase [Burkholderiales bacterium]|nr:leucyl/phenylalanyl-tRNA--protein transferase [Burkholderiales bacterium]